MFSLFTQERIAHCPVLVAMKYVKYEDIFPCLLPLIYFTSYLILDFLTFVYNIELKILIILDKIHNNSFNFTRGFTYLLRNK